MTTRSATPTPRSYGDSDAPHMSPVTPAEDSRTIFINQVAWGAVFAGVAVALVIQLLLNILGIGVGAAALGPVGAADESDAANFSIGAAVWWMVAGVIAAFIGGHAAGRLSGRPKESTAGWHGLIAWAATTLTVCYLLTTAIGSVLGGTLSALGGLGQQAASVATAAAGDSADPLSAIERDIRQATGEDRDALRAAAAAAVRAALTGDQAQAQEARERAAEALARLYNTDIDGGRARLAQYEAQYRRAIEEAKQAAEVARQVTSQAAIWGVVALVFGAIAAWMGGRTGAVTPTITDPLLAATERS